MHLLMYVMHYIIHFHNYELIHLCRCDMRYEDVRLNTINEIVWIHLPKYDSFGIYLRHT